MIFCIRVCSKLTFTSSGNVSLGPQNTIGSVDCVIYPHRLSDNVVKDETVRKRLFCHSFTIQSLSLILSFSRSRLNVECFDAQF
jgi:hypothetical protein